MSININQPHHEDPHMAFLCPRCGYDLRGIIQTWQSAGACPLTGKCSECGLDFDWQRVFRDSEHPWLFEKRYRHHPVSSFAKTLLMTFRPRTFWREIDMMDRVRIGPLLALPFAITIILIMFRLVVALWSYNNARAAFAMWNSIGGTFSITGFFNYWFNHSSWAWNGEIIPLFAWMTISCIIWSLLMIALFGLLPASLSRYRVRKINLLRVSAYTVVPLMTYIIAWAVADIILILLGQFLGYHINGIYGSSLFGMLYMTLIGWFIWQIICWFFACKYYLKLPHAFWIAILLTTASGLTLILAHILWWNYQVQVNGVDTSSWEYHIFVQ